MLLSTPQLARVHNLEDHQVNLTANGQMLERVTTTHLLGTELQQNLDWNSDTNTKISSCYATLSVLRKLKNLAPFQVRKQLAESLILSKLDYNDTVTFPIYDYLVKRLQRVQLAAAGKIYTNLQDILKIGWLPIPEAAVPHGQTCFPICKLQRLAQTTKNSAICASKRPTIQQRVQTLF